MFAHLPFICFTLESTWTFGLCRSFQSLFVYFIPMSIPIQFQSSVCRWIKKKHDMYILVHKVEFILDDFQSNICWLTHELFSMYSHRSHSNKYVQYSIQIYEYTLENPPKAQRQLGVTHQFFKHGDSFGVRFDRETLVLVVLCYIIACGVRIDDVRYL